MTVIDCTSPPPVAAMRAAGVTGLCRYLAYVKPSTDFKRITQPEYDQLRAAGFDIVLNWEMAATDWLGGASAGAAHAAEAVKQARALGHPAGCAIPGSADFNMTHDQWNGPCWQYARAYSSGIRSGGYRAGVYGPWDVLEWCATTGWFDMFWQAGMSTSWSGGRNAQQWPGAHLRQRRQTFIGGVDCDLNDVLQVNYGQYGVDAEEIDVDTVIAWNTGWRLQGILKEQDPIVVPPNADIGATGFSEPNLLLQRAKAVQAAITGPGAPTDEQVDAAVAKVMNDPAWLAQLGAEFASHFHVS